MRVKPLIFFLLVYGATACQSEPPAAQDRLPKSCATMCTQAACNGTTLLDPESVDVCARACVDQAELTRGVSGSCGGAYATSVGCLATLECVDFEAFLEDEPHPCVGALLRFDETCEDLEFGFPE